MKKALLTLITVGAFASAAAYAGTTYGTTYHSAYGTSESQARSNALGAAKYARPDATAYGISSCYNMHVGPGWQCTAWAYK
ncbi:hypothetical protein [Shewanella khirikhana]|uniref:hypothetical protein n=1 Tax=Shewanella khirikhana TaxID=1965282 RepID=UPI000F7E3B03|nr:hypothetical protein [Shewanella khirikhana]